MFSIQVLFVTVMALALATISIAEDLVWFENYTNTGRYIIFTPNSPSHSIGDIYLPPGSSSNPGRTTVHFNNLGAGWQGNFKILMPGTSHGVNAVLGEVCFRCTNGNTYYNVSVVPDPNSNIGINYLFPFNDHTAGQVSGCPHFPCSGSYTKPGDHQTKTTWDNHLVCQVKPSSVMTPEHDFIVLAFHIDFITLLY